MPCPHGFDNENLCSLCHSGQEIKILPQKNIRLKTAKELKKYPKFSTGK